jgi:hypothetical protein
MLRIFERSIIVNMPDEGKYGDHGITMNFINYVMSQMQ